MDSETIKTSELAVPVARFYKLVRFLMAEHPLEAESMTVDIPEISEAMSRGRCIIKLERDPGLKKDAGYIVIRDGTAYTTLTLPSGTRKEDILVVHVPKPAPTLFPKLKAAGQAVYAISANTYEGLRCGEIIKSVSTYYEGENVSDPLNNDPLISSLTANVPQEPSDLTTSEPGVELWALECANRLLGAYARFAIAGDAVIEALATLVFYRISPSPQRLFYFGTLGGDSRPSMLTSFRLTLGRTDSLSSASDSGYDLHPIPALNIDFYLLHPELAGPDTFSAARRCARFLQREGDNFQKEGRSQAGFSKFHNSLYKALLYYRSAKVVYDSLTSKDVRELLPLYVDLAPDFEELARDRDACEERRVTILQTLIRVVGDHRGEPDFTNGDQLIAWVEWLYTLNFEEAEMHIHDLYMRLIYPQFVRDLTLGCIQLKNSSTFEKGVAYLTRVAELLEINLAANTMLEEVNYLSYTYKILATAFEQAGRLDEARLYNTKASPEYLQERMSQVF